MNSAYIVLCLNAQQQAQDEAWVAYLANVPMTWIAR
jgi:hypothetical protein